MTERMPLPPRRQDTAVNPQSLVYLCCLAGLLLLTYAVIGRNMVMAAAVAALPAAVVVCYTGMRHPLFSYTLYCATTLYFSAIYRYSEISGLSILNDIFLGICLLSLAINFAAKGDTEYQWRNAFNILSVGQLLWIVFALLEQFAPYSSFNDIVKSRAFFTVVPVSCLLSGMLLDSPKRLKAVLWMLGIYVITAAMKLYWQKYHGWDWAETKFLMDYEAWGTHLLQSGARYFSFFSDAGNFGASMGVLATVFGIASMGIKRIWFRCFCIGVTLLAGLGMVMSGTRGAIVIPFCGLLTYSLLSKDLKTILFSLITVAACFCFFSFTDIGNDNGFIRRVRTAFHPEEDASYNIRMENRERFAYYLQDKPFGIGLGNHVVDTKRIRIVKEEFIATDSYLVDIWVENGIVGLCVYLCFMGTVLLRGCYLLLFKVKHKQLRQILTGMLGAVFGLLVNAYVGRAMGTTPCNLLVPIFLSLILNAPYIEKQLPSGYKF